MVFTFPNLHWKGGFWESYCVVIFSFNHGHPSKPLCRKIGSIDAVGNCLRPQSHPCLQPLAISSVRARAALPLSLQSPSTFTGPVFPSSFGPYGHCLDFYQETTTAHCIAWFCVSTLSTPALITCSLNRLCAMRLLMNPEASAVVVCPHPSHVQYGPFLILPRLPTLLFFFFYSLAIIFSRPCHSCYFVWPSNLIF